MMKPEEQFLAAYDDFAPSILRHISMRVSDQELAKELAQETFFKAWRHLAAGGEVKNFRAFFYRIANNLIIDYYRSKKKETVPIENIENDINFSSQEKNAGLEIGFLEKSLRELKDDQQQILLLRYSDGLSIKEISKITGKSITNISVMLHRVLKLLREKANV